MAAHNNTSAPRSAARRPFSSASSCSHSCNGSADSRSAKLDSCTLINLEQSQAGGNLRAAVGRAPFSQRSFFFFMFLSSATCELKLVGVGLPVKIQFSKQKEITIPVHVHCLDKCIILFSELYTPQSQCCPKLEGLNDRLVLISHHKPIYSVCKYFFCSLTLELEG